MKDEGNSPVPLSRFSTTFLTELQEFQNKFSEYFNVSSIIFDENGKHVTNPSGFNKFCAIIQKAKAEGKLSSDPTKTIDEIHTDNCSFFSDIAETVIPIKYKNETISTWAVTKNCFGDIPREDINDVADKIGADPDKLWDELQDIPTTTQEEFDRSVYFLHETITTLMRMREQDDELKENLVKFEELTKVTAHDMREHLRIILGFMDLLNDKYHSKFDAEFDTYLYYISEAGNKLKDVADELIEKCERR